MSKTRLMTAATTALAGLLLTGCGSASPGVAVKVGDEEITTRHVDAVTANYCTAVGDLESGRHAPVLARGRVDHEADALGS